MSTIEMEICPDVFQLQAGLDDLFAKRAKREPLTADESGFLVWLFRRSNDNDQVRIETARMAAVLAAQSSYLSAIDAGDARSVDRATTTLRRLTPHWIKNPVGHPLAVEESQARRELGEMTIRRDTLRTVTSCCRLEPRGTAAGTVEHFRLPPREDDRVVVEFCKREFPPGHPCHPRQRSDGAMNTDWVDLASWLVACRELSAEADRIDLQIPEAEARLAEIAAARLEHEAERGNVYLP